MREWRNRLQAFVAGGGYRIAARPATIVLAEQMSAPRVSTEERVGAALALRVASPADAVQRIRVAAQQCVDARAREALEAVAADEIDEQAIDRALR